jgi:hypothetical protein
MPKRIALVGHCGADASYLIITIRRAISDAQVILIDDEASLAKLLGNGGVDLLLLNRQLNYGFSQSQGVDLIRSLRTAHPHLKMMLVSNYSEAQAQAVEAGASPGFGKRELGTPRVAALLSDLFIVPSDSRMMTESQKS